MIRLCNKSEDNYETCIFIWNIRLVLIITLVAQTGIWQWSVPVRNFSTHPKNPESRAYLWIPSQCEQVKAILVAQHKYGGNFYP